MKFPKYLISKSQRTDLSNMYDNKHEIFLPNTVVIILKWSLWRKLAYIERALENFPVTSYSEWIDSKEFGFTFKLGREADRERIAKYTEEKSDFE